MKKYYTEKADIIGAVKRVNTRINNAQNEWQLIALSVLAHLVVHGQKGILDTITGPSGITKSNGVQKSRMTLFLSVALKAPFESGAFQFPKEFKHQDIDVDAAAEVKWYNMKADPATDTSKSLGELLIQFEKGAKASITAGKMTEAERDSVIAHVEGLITEHVAPIAEAA
jgi:hypothetical protein